MSESKKVGQWAALFGGRRSFKVEIAQAKEIGAEFLCGDGRRSIVLNELPGWLAPLWGSDEKWLYVRRPEGIWKALLPVEFKGDARIWLYQHAKGAGGKKQMLGGACIGDSLAGHAGWIRGNAVLQPIDAADMDEIACPANRGFQVDADAVGSAWGELISRGPKQLLIKGGAYFDAKPRFSVINGWLMAKSSKADYTVAYPIETYPDLQSALKEGRLWLRYESAWLPAFDVKVELESI